MRFLSLSVVSNSRQRFGLRQSSAAFHSSFVLVLVLVLVACSKSDHKPEARAPDHPVRSLPPTSALHDAPFYILQSELSPATLVFSTNKYLSLFTGLDQYGLGAPSYLAFATRDGPRAFTNGTRVVAGHMDESWLLVWFAGARGWTNGDVPWAVFLQRKPASMKLDAEGLHLGFRGGAEHVILLPLYGYQKLPIGAQPPPPRKTKGSRSKEITTSKWPAVLPKEVLMRVRYWAGAARQFPIDCEESFSTNRSRDTVTLRFRFDWLSTRDDWNTRPIKLAPIPLSLALASTNKQSPVQFSAEIMDLDYITPYGPFKAIQDIDQYDITFPIGHFVNETNTRWSSSFSLSGTNAEPRLIWPAWKTPSGDPWTFGHVNPGATGAPPSFRVLPLNRNTRALVFE